VFQACSFNALSFGHDAIVEGHATRSAACLKDGEAAGHLIADIQPALGLATWRQELVFAVVLLGPFWIQTCTELAT
jgi:hypothetical protein